MAEMYTHDKTTARTGGGGTTNEGEDDLAKNTLKVDENK